MTASSAIFRTATLELTKRCNWRCVHCYADASPEQPMLGSVTASHWKELLRRLNSEGCSSVQFIGGEVMLHPELLELVDYATNLGMEVEVYSNLSVLKPQLVELASRRNVKFATSFYSTNPDVFNRIVGRRGAHARVVENIRHLVAHNHRLRVGVVIMDENAGERDGIRDFLLGIGVTKVDFDAMRGVGRGERAAGGGLGELCGYCGQDGLTFAADGTVYPCVMSKEWPVGRFVDGALDDEEIPVRLTEFRTALDEVRQRQRTTACPVTRCDPNKCIVQCTPDECVPCRPTD